LRAVNYARNPLQNACKETVEDDDFRKRVLCILGTSQIDNQSSLAEQKVCILLKDIREKLKLIFKETPNRANREEAHFIVTITKQLLERPFFVCYLKAKTALFEIIGVLLQYRCDHKMAPTLIFAFISIFSAAKLHFGDKLTLDMRRQIWDTLKIINFNNNDKDTERRLNDLKAYLQFASAKSDEE